MTLNQSDFVDAHHVKPQFIRSILENAGITTRQATYDEIVAVVGNTSIVLIIQEDYIALENIRNLNTWLGRAFDFKDVAFKCNECNSTALFSSYVKRDIDNQLLLCTYCPILFTRKFSISEFIYQLHHFASTSKIIQESIGKLITN